MRRGEFTASRRRFHPSREAGDLLLAIASALNPFVRGGEQHRCARRFSAVEGNFFDARQHLMHALVECADEHGVGDDRVEAFEMRHPRQQIPIGGEQPVGIECAVSDRQHDVPVRAQRRRCR